LHTTRRNKLGASTQGASVRSHGHHPYDQGPAHKGLCPNISQKWVLTIAYDFLLILLLKLEIFGQILGDIGPFLRPYLGGKLGDGYQLHIYIK